MLSFEDIVFVSGILGAISVLFFFYKSDEIPIVMTMLYATSGLYRYYVVVVNPDNLRVGWVTVAYAKNIFSMTNDLAIVALNYFLLGTSIWVLSYIIFRLILGKPKKTIDIKPLLSAYITTKKQVIFYTFCLVVIGAFYTQVGLVSRFVETGSLNVSTTGLSYFVFLPFALGGLIILMFLIYRGIDYKVDPSNKIIFLALIVIAGIQSYNPGARFNFLSWSIALVFIIVRKRSIWFKTMVYTVGILAGLIVFSFAGLTRTPGAYALDFEGKVNMALDRIKSAEDQNLLDGFMMALQVYPQHLDYQYGFQHVEILLRPIPRAIWPDKPLGGYANKLALNDVEANNGLTVGISESIYGTFYGEGGVTGIILLSFLYGLMFAVIIYRGERYESDMRYVIKGIVVAVAIVLIRGGDLAGIVAFVGMSYWPVFIANFQYGKYLTRFNAWYKDIMTARRFAAVTNSLPETKA